jgi:hypothetical protein
MPEAVGDRPDSAADRLGDRVSDREEGTDSSFPHVADVGEEGFRGSGTVGADEDVGAVPVSVGDLRERLVEHRDVVGGSVGAGVTGPQPSRHGLAGVREETQQRMEAEAALVGRGRPVPFPSGRRPAWRRGPEPGREALVRRPEQQVCPRRSRWPASRRLPGRRRGPLAVRQLQPHRCQRATARPWAQRRPGRTPRPGPQHGQIRDRLTAVGEHHREIGGDPSRVMPGPARPKRPESGGVRGGQPCGVSEIHQQPCPGM